MSTPLHPTPRPPVSTVDWKPPGHTLESPGEIKRKEVSWTLTKKLDAFAGPGELKRREVVLDPQVSPEEIKSREVELGSESWTSFASVLFSPAELRTLSLCLFRTAVETAIAQYTSCCAVASGHCLLYFCCPGGGPRHFGLPGWRLRSRPHSFAPGRFRHP